MKMSKFKLAFIVLLVVTMVYAVTLHQSVQAYNEWREEDRQKYAEQYEGHVPSYTHFLTTKTGIVFDVAGITLFFAWSFAIVKLALN
jgi:hypothetical protein